MRRCLIWLAVSFALAARPAWAFRPRPLVVDIAVIGRRYIVIEVEGTMRIREVVTASAPIAGGMARLQLHAGNVVTAGGTAVACIRPAAPTLLDARAGENERHDRRRGLWRTTDPKSRSNGSTLRYG